MAATLAVVVTAAVLAVQRDQPDTSVVPEAVLAVEQPPSGGQAQPPFRASVNLVRVDVHATTSSGPVLDLGQNDFEVYENGVLQKIGSFEHVVSRVPVPEFERTEPRSDLEAQDAVADLRNRLFVVLFDTLNTEGYRKDDKSAAPTYDPQSVGRELTMFLHRSIGEDDLVAVMHPEMSILVAAFHAAAVALRRIPAVGGGVAEAFRRWSCRRGRKTGTTPVTRPPRSGTSSSVWSPGAAR